MPKPKIAILLDEDTRDGGANYRLNKDYCHAITAVGGLPLCIPYDPNAAQFAIDEYDGFFSPGGGMAFPDEWHETGHQSPFPSSKRIAIEIEIMKGFLERDKPTFGSCHGMQVLAAIHGCKLRSDAGEKHSVQSLDEKKMHTVSIVPGSKIAQITGQTQMSVNTRHREYVSQICDPVIEAAHAEDGIIEAIEIKGKRFAIGCQWHQENFWQEDHPGNKLFQAFVEETKNGIN